VIDLAPLLLLWAIGSKRSSSVDVPRWPTAVSPPPPPPLPPLPPPQGAAPPGVPTWNAFTGVPDPASAQHPAESPAAPLSELLHQADVLHAAHAAASKAVSKAKAAPKRLLKGILHAPAVGPPAPAQENVSVADLQKILIRRGAKLAKDGLYGPKTAAAWKAAASAKHLSPMITRVGPKIARVANATFDALSVPAIP
jgi:hypothetical protein